MAYKQIHTGTVPSENLSLRDARWYEDQHVAGAYMWGRMDAGESHRNVNHNYAFSEAWADASWAFRNHDRVSLPTMAGALAKHDAGEVI